MELIRINVSLPKDIVAELSRKLPARKRSKFIADAVKKHLKEQKARQLAAEYEEAAEEMRKMNRELEGTLNDGLR
jgi:metal-responsive CopG/Arc/MetJ family transcriptional regulator